MAQPSSHPFTAPVLSLASHATADQITTSWLSILARKAGMTPDDTSIAHGIDVPARSISNPDYREGDIPLPEKQTVDGDLLLLKHDGVFLAAKRLDRTHVRIYPWELGLARSVELADGTGRNAILTHQKSINPETGIAFSLRSLPEVEPDLAEVIRSDLRQIVDGFTSPGLDFYPPLLMGPHDGFGAQFHARMSQLLPWIRMWRDDIAGSALTLFQIGMTQCPHEVSSNFFFYFDGTFRDQEEISDLTRNLGRIVGTWFDRDPTQFGFSRLSLKLRGIWRRGSIRVIVPQKRPDVSAHELLALFEEIGQGAMSPS